MRAAYVRSKAMTQVSCLPAVRETVPGPPGPALLLQSWGEVVKGGRNHFLPGLAGTAQWGRDDLGRSLARRVSGLKAAEVEEGRPEINGAGRRAPGERLEGMLETSPGD